MRKPAASVPQDMGLKASFLLILAVRGTDLMGTALVLDDGFCQGAANSACLTAMHWACRCAGARSNLAGLPAALE